MPANVNRIAIMAQLSEILSQEKMRTDSTAMREIRLYREGGFWRAYEWSAWLFCRYVSQFKVTKREIKSVGDAMVLSI